MNPRRELDEDTLRNQLTSAADLIDPHPPTRDELDALRRRPGRGHRALRMSPPLLVAAAVAAIAVAATAVAVAVQHRSEPLPPATHHSSPTTLPSTVPAPRPSTIIAPNRPSTRGTTTPLANTTPSRPTSSSTTSPSTSSAAPPSGLQLVTGPYGFLVPAGWHTHPLWNGQGSGSWASFTQGPAAAQLTAPVPNSVLYSLWGGSGLIYTRDGTPVLSEAVNHALCQPTHWQPISPSAISFTCAPVAGMQPRGILIVNPRPGGTKQVVVTVPADEQATATEILGSFH